MNKKLISIVLVTKNSIKYIDYFLNSYSSMLIDRDQVELIVVDGLSHDGTIQVLEKKRNLIDCLISENDLGIYDAMNKGVDNSLGKWIFFIGSDDIFCSKNVLLDLCEILKYECDNVSLVVGQHLRSNKIINSHFNFKLLFGNCLNHQSVLYRREIFERYKYDTNYFLASDYKLNLICFLNRLNCRYLHFPIVHYGLLGISSMKVKLGLIEMDNIRVDILGHVIGGVLNFIINFKRFLWSLLHDINFVLKK